MEKHIKDLVFCKCCNKLFTTPILLPCSNNICQEHLFKFPQQDKFQAFECFFCNQIHEPPKEGFPINNTIKTLIKLNFDKLKFGGTYQEALASCNKAENSLKTLKQINSDPVNYISDVFSSLRWKVDMRKEEIKSFVDREADKFIKQIDSSETECKDQVQLVKSLNDKISILENQLESWKSELDQFVYDEVKWKTIHAMATVKNNSIESIKKDLVNQLFKGNTYAFETGPQVIDSEMLLGKYRIESKESKSLESCFFKRSYSNIPTPPRLYGTSSQPGYKIVNTKSGFPQFSLINPNSSYEQDSDSYTDTD